MIKIAVIADDFTGSLDTGIKFAQAGAATQMMIGAEFELTRVAAGCEVLIIDSETRHLQPERAYEIVYGLVKRLESLEVGSVYKKTDSALRGCVGAELAALSDALEARVHFVPALPGENRITVNGIQYIDGLPVSKSVFGTDPFEPVRHDAVADIIQEQNDIPVFSEGDVSNLPDGGRVIVVYDACTEQEIDVIAEGLERAGELRAVAGCAGFAERLSKVIGPGGKKERAISRAEGIFVVCGTVNERTGRQLSYAGDHGFCRVSLTTEQKLLPDYLTTEKGKRFSDGLKSLCKGERPVIVDVFDKADVVSEAERYCRSHGIAVEDIRVRIAERLSELLELWLSFGLDHTLVMSGGDTVYSFLKYIRCEEVYPLCEVDKGAILFQAKMKNDEKVLRIVSKSGGFGTEDFFVKMLDVLTLTGGGS